MPLALRLLQWRIFKFASGLKLENATEGNSLSNLKIIRTQISSSWLSALAKPPGREVVGCASGRALPRRLLGTESPSFLPLVGAALFPLYSLPILVDATAWKSDASLAGLTSIRRTCGRHDGDRMRCNTAHKSREGSSIESRHLLKAAT
jgi:hypothetical protein